jgi:hypothetical protein
MGTLFPNIWLSIHSGHDKCSRERHGAEVILENVELDRAS